MIENNKSPDGANPVDFYNANCIQETFDFMVSQKNVEKVGVDAFTYVENADDKKKRMIEIKDGFFVASMSNGLKMEVGKPYSPFHMIQMFRFKGSFMRTLSWVNHEILGKSNEYIRIGTKYFKRVNRVDRNGINRHTLVGWEKQTIVDDFGRGFLDDIPKFDFFNIIPDNRNHIPFDDKSYNLYAPFEHSPAPIDSDGIVDELKFYWTKTLMEHIFGEQYELGIKYLKVLYDMPKQKLPILVLTSKERSTGKTTFIDYLEMLFGDNTVIINPENISSQFNGAYSDKNIIMIEESRFDSIQATEKLKNLATQKKMLVNTKHVQEYSVPFYGKVIITSNDEDKFSRVDDPEIRYWVRKIPTLQGKANHGILNDLKKEIPHFLAYLNTLPDVDTSKSRMVFTAEEIETEALMTVKKESLPTLHKDIMTHLELHCESNPSVKKIYFTAKDVQNQLMRYQNTSISYINKILKDSIGLKKKGAMRYKPFEIDNSISQNKEMGRPYEFKNPYYEKKKEEQPREGELF